MYIGSIVDLCGGTWKLGFLMLLFAQKTGLFPIGGLTSADFSDMSLLSKIKDILWHLIFKTHVILV